jgi:hypothetical protein
MDTRRPGASWAMINEPVFLSKTMLDGPARQAEMMMMGAPVFAPLR